MPTIPLSEAEMRETATRLRKMCSDQRIKSQFSAAMRKRMNDLATEIMIVLEAEESEAARE